MVEWGSQGEGNPSLCQVDPVVGKVNVCLMFLQKVKAQNSLNSKWTHHYNTGSYAVSIQVQIDCC